jgi:hypothetical protein
MSPYRLTTAIAGIKKKPLTETERIHIALQSNAAIHLDILEIIAM